LSSHILPEITATCSRVIIINKGKIVAQDTLEELTLRLKRGLIYSMQVKEVNEAGLNAIRSIAGVASVTSAGSKVVVEIASQAGEVRDQIINAAVAKHMGVLEFSAERVSLEEIFLQLTTEDKASLTN
jgi:ABC-2 type transport system ATP-binding protein